MGAHPQSPRSEGADPFVGPSLPLVGDFAYERTRGLLLTVNVSEARSLWGNPNRSRWDYMDGTRPAA